MRNPVLASHATHILPYRGLGTGIPRVLESYNAVEFTDDREANQFKVVIKRRLMVTIHRANTLMIQDTTSDAKN